MMRCIALVVLFAASQDVAHLKRGYAVTAFPTGSGPRHSFGFYSAERFATPVAARVAAPAATPATVPSPVGGSVLPPHITDAPSGAPNAVRVATPVAPLVKFAADTGNTNTSSHETNTPTISASTDFPTAAPFVVPPLDCYMDLRELQRDVRAKDPFIKAVYKLCPNTVYEMGHPNASSYCCVNGYPPLWPRRGATYQCGDSGQSSNNCTLRGGASQVLSYAGHFQGEPKTDTAFRGITFESASGSAVLLMTAGEFLFDDCIFQNHKGIGSIKLARHIEGEAVTMTESEDSDGNVNQMSMGNPYEGFADSQSVHAERPNDDDALKYDAYVEHRSMDGDSNRRLWSMDDQQRQRVTFHNCLFVNNKHGSKVDESAHNGIINTQTAFVDVVVNSSIFVNNDFDGRNIVGNTFAIQVLQDSTLDIQSTCFFDNDFKGRGVVLVERADSIVAQRVNYGFDDDINLDCPFINAGDSDSKCISYTGATCMAERYQSLVERGILRPSRTVAVESAESSDLDATKSSSTPLTLGLALQVYRIALLCAWGFTMTYY